jgi:hypothetical protein
MRNHTPLLPVLAQLHGEELRAKLSVHTHAVAAQSLGALVHVEEDVPFAQGILVKRHIARHGRDDGVVVALPLRRPR